MTIEKPTKESRAKASTTHLQTSKSFYLVDGGLAKQSSSKASKVSESNFLQFRYQLDALLLQDLGFSWSQPKHLLWEFL